MRYVAPCVLLIALAGCKKATTDAADATVPVTTVKSTSGDFAVKRIYPAIATPVTKVDLDVRVPGYLEQRLVKQGAHVEAGELLFVIEQAPYEASVVSAEAALSKARADLALADVVVARNAPLVESGAVSQEAFDQYEANVLVARAALEMAQAELVQAELNLSYTEIRAPIAGRIGATSVDPPTYVAPGTQNATLCTLVTANPIRINFAPAANEFPEYLANWQTIQSREVHVTIPRNDAWSRDGVISFVDNAANPDTSLIRMWTDVENHDYQLLPGQYCEVTVTMNILKDVVQIPSDALVQVASRNYVWVVGSDQKVTQTKVEVQLQQDGTAVIKSGLEAGQTIVQQGVNKLRFNGTEVTKAPPALKPGERPKMPESNDSKH